MRRNRTTAILALGLVLAACEKDKPMADYAADPMAIRIHPYITAAYTRSAPTGDQTAFQPGDQIALSCEDGSMVFTLTGTDTWQPADKNYLVWYPSYMPDYYGVYPVATGVTAGNFQVPSSQNKLEKLAACDYMVATVTAPSYTGSQVMELPMERKMAKVVVTLTGIADDSRVQGLRINSYRGYEAGQVVTGSLVAISPYAEIPEGGKPGGNGTVYTALVVPGPAADETFLSLSYGGKSVTLNGIPALQAGKAYTYTLDIEGGKIHLGDPVVGDWEDGTIPGGEAQPERPPYADGYFISVAGSGDKSGNDADNTMDLAAFRALVATVVIDTDDPSTQAASDANATLLDGQTFHFTGGTYPLSTDTGGLKIEYSGYAKQVSLTFEGDENVIFTGEKVRRILTLGNQVHLTVKGCTFQDGSSNEAGAGIHVAAGANGDASLTLQGTRFDNNIASIDDKRSGGALRCSKGTIDAEGCVFTESNYAQNGGSVYTDNANSKVHFTGCTFQSHANNTGGAANNSGGTQTYTDCDFTGCYTETGWGGAIHANAADAVVTVDHCRFTACRGMTAELAKTTTSKATGIISVQTADVTINASRFEGCEGISGAVIFLQDNDGILKCTDTVFKDNIGRSRGIIQTNGKGIAFFDGCTFTGNRMTTNAWGLILHGGNPSACGFNNCTFYGNTRDQSGGNGVGLNNDGSILLTNSTYIGNDDLVAVRNTNATNAMVLLENAILVNTGAGPVTADDKMKCPHTFSHLLTGTSESVLGGGSFSEAQGVYLWNGPDASFGKTDATAFETAVKAVTVDNGNAVLGGTTVGAAFYDWLVSIGTIGKDAIGNGRGTAWWPGAYQE